MNSLKKEIISAKELALLGILIVLVAYYFVVQGPIASQTKEIERSLSKVNSKIAEAQIKADNMTVMQKAIDEVFDEYGGNPPLLPRYNNMNGIIAELNGILADTVDYDVAFGEEATDETIPNIVRRPISISFTAKSYKSAVSTVREINDSSNRYLITDVSINETKTWSNRWGVFGSAAYGGEYSVYGVSITMLSFEYKE